MPNYDQKIKYNNLNCDLKIDSEEIVFHKLEHSKSKDHKMNKKLISYVLNFIK